MFRFDASRNENTGGEIEREREREREEGREREQRLRNRGSVWWERVDRQAGRIGG